MLIGVTTLAPRLSQRSGSVEALTSTKLGQRFARALREMGARGTYWRLISSSTDLYSD